MILVDLEAPEGIATADLDALVARWGQSVRHAIADGAPDTTVGMVRGHVLAISSDNILAALTLAHATLTT